MKVWANASWVDIELDSEFLSDNAAAVTPCSASSELLYGRQNGTASFARIQARRLRPR